MKKNVMMRVASIMLILVLMTSSVISGTFAKYVTSGKSSDTARVAVWGVEVTADYSNFFKDIYTSATAYNDGISVDSIYGGDVVAPGTDGELADFTVTGTPEVDVAVTYDATLTFTGDWLADKDDDDNIDDEYCPIIFTVNTKTLYIGGTDIEGNAITNMADLKTAVENAIEKSADKYDAGTDLSTVVYEDLFVSWQWQFDNNVAGFLGADGQDDNRDTDLGNWLKEGNAAPTLELDVKCTVTQID